uniref:Uncharacterized protein n=1 Tax=viral metagenome TaxID=1070528 RepID=A0A6M3ILF5_9ZZZZ
MTNQERFLNWLYTNALAETATLAVITGTACPCMISRDSSRPSYSEQWHRDNPGAADCTGTGIISSTTTTTTFKGIFIAPGLVANTIPTMQERLMQIGEIRDDDLFLWGLVNSSTLAVVSILGASEYTHKITRNSIDYSIKTAWEIPQLGYAGHLRRRA